MKAIHYKMKRKEKLIMFGNLLETEKLHGTCRAGSKHESKTSELLRQTGSTCAG